MNADNIKQISFIQHEAEMFRAERLQNRLMYFCLLLLALLITTNAVWIIHYLKVAS